MSFWIINQFIPGLSDSSQTHRLQHFKDSNGLTTGSLPTCIEIGSRKTVQEIL
uniref:Uncharacterized protein n=1 Tax=Megaselia scalaris TaxID=36166 RepID=T1GE49_MEGSC